ncbi:MAG: acyl-CoA dehydrogenase family protein, partial [Nitrospinota bacterium]
MRFAFTEAQEKFRQEVHAFFEQEVTPELVEAWATQADHCPELYAKMAERGWLGVQWPKEYG